jgi:hypothetical protein
MVTVPIEADVDVDIDEYLEYASDKAFAKEIERRKASKEAKKTADALAKGVVPWTREAVADDLRSAFYRRDACRFEALLIVLEDHDGRPRYEKLKLTA